MQIIKIKERLSLEERECLLNFDSVDKKWTMDTTVMKYYNKAIKQGWTQLKKYVYDDNSVCGGVFEAPDYSVTIRSVVKKQLSDKQKMNLDSGEDEEED
jgi:hypothetical protein